MSKLTLVKPVGHLWAVVLLAVAPLAVGCSAAPTSTVAPTTTNAEVKGVEQASSQTQVTFYVAGMNERLKILWGDWPNTVKQALLELDAVVSVEDEWERELESEEDLDLLFVTYDARRITVDAVLERIRELGFEVKVAE